MPISPNNILSTNLLIKNETINREHTPYPSIVGHLPKCLLRRGEGGGREETARVLPYACVVVMVVWVCVCPTTILVNCKLKRKNSLSWRLATFGCIVFFRTAGHIYKIKRVSCMHVCMVLDTVDSTVCSSCGRGCSQCMFYRSCGVWLKFLVVCFDLLQPPDHPVMWQWPKEINFLDGAHVAPNTPPILKRVLYKISGLARTIKGMFGPIQLH